MGPWYYEVVSFDGDYVNLRRTDIESEVKCEYFQYEVIG